MPYVQGCNCEPCIRAHRNGEPVEPNPTARDIITNWSGSNVSLLLPHNVFDQVDQAMGRSPGTPAAPRECELCGRTDVVTGTDYPPRCSRHVDRQRCELCSYRHARDEPMCVECNHCIEGYHGGPACCAPVETGPVYCEQCSGTHSGPACSARLDESRCWSCRSCDFANRLLARRGRNRRYAREMSENTSVYNYSFVPDPLVFRGTGPLYYGMELELEVNDLRTSVSSAAGLANGYLEHDGDGDGIGYLKEDGSIDYGFEIVTHPMSYPYFVDHYPWAMLEELKDMGCRTTRGTGIHVHVSKAGFTPVHAYKWLKFWYRNQDWITVFARRTSEQWAAFNQSERSRVKYYCKGDMTTGPSGQDGYYSPQRYSAINVGPEHTYEVRVFRSSLSPRVARATLGLVAATVDYTREITPREIIGKGAWEWPAFAKWAKKHSSQYPDLNREITRVNTAVANS